MTTRKKRHWTAFAHPQSAFDYEGPALRKNWARLHRGDREPWPGAEQVGRLLRAHPAAREAAGADAAGTAAQLQQAWRLYHQGCFEEAAELGASLGPIGHAVADKATEIYANYLEPDEATRRALYQQVIERSQAAIDAWPEQPNAHYFHAYALGRLSQSISVLQALAEGYAPRIRRALDATLAIDPEHAEAHIALGTYHAEIVAKVGGLMAALTYGASSGAAIEHYERAIALMPDSAVARVEYADGLIAMHGRSRREQARRLYEEAAAVEPIDAMGWLDVALARSRLERQ